MARNRKNETGFRLGPLLMAVTLCALFAMLGVGYVWYKNQISVLGRQIKERENLLSELQRENRARRDQLAALCSPVSLDAQSRKWNLGLGPPALSQIVTLDEPADAVPVAPWPQPAPGPLAAAAPPGGRRY